MWKSELKSNEGGLAQACVLLLWWSGLAVFRSDKLAPPSLMTHQRGENGVGADVLRVQCSASSPLQPSCRSGQDPGDCVKDPALKVLSRQPSGIAGLRIYFFLLFCILFFAQRRNSVTLHLIIVIIIFCILLIFAWNGLWGETGVEMYRPQQGPCPTTSTASACVTLCAIRRDSDRSAIHSFTEQE